MATRRYLILGIDNPYGSNPELALSPTIEGSAGQRLFRLSGLQIDEYERAFRRDNVFAYQEHERVSHATRIRRAVKALGRHTEGVEELRVVVLGRKVASLLGLGDSPWMRWKRIYLPSLFGHRIYAAVIPHPSGLNRWYNSQDNLDKARGFLRRSARYALKEAA